MAQKRSKVSKGASVIGDDEGTEGGFSQMSAADKLQNKAPIKAKEDEKGVINQTKLGETFRTNQKQQKTLKGDVKVELPQKVISTQNLV